MFCPTCGAEYRSGFTRCADCGIPLVEVLSPDVPPPEESGPVFAQFATVRAYTMPYEAAIVRSLLEAEGVSSFLMDYHTIYINWLYSNALGGVKLQVHQDDVAPAREIIESALLSAKERALEYSEGACPVCRSMKTSPVVRGRQWAVLTWLIVGMPLVWPWIRLRCSSCGNVWRDKQRHSDDTEVQQN